mmetsp:Transcript_17151/g.43621  ORF Transcript_17151/g.43621 Transcript_17151/m.43621 type:complete len:207 (-) Transcript_17151:423-1043(-)
MLRDSIGHEQEAPRGAYRHAHDSEDHLLAQEHGRAFRRPQLQQHGRKLDIEQQLKPQGSSTHERHVQQPAIHAAELGLAIGVVQGGQHDDEHHTGQDPPHENGEVHGPGRGAADLRETREPQQAHSASNAYHSSDYRFTRNTLPQKGPGKNSHQEGVHPGHHHDHTRRREEIAEDVRHCRAHVQGCSAIPHHTRAHGRLLGLPLPR